MPRWQSRRTYGTNWYNRKPSFLSGLKSASVGKVATAAAKKVFRAETEQKYIEYQYTSINGTSLASIGYGPANQAALLSGIAQGTSMSQRVGQKIILEKIDFQFPFQNGDPTNYVRFLLVTAIRGDSGLTGAALTADIFSGQAAAVSQHGAAVDKTRWRVLYDRLLYLPNIGNFAGNIPSSRTIKKTIRLNKRIQWDRTNAIDNDIYMVAISDSGAAPNPGAVSGYMRLYFRDA